MMRPISSFTLLLSLLATPLCHAERADRLQPMVVESDGRQAASVDLNRKITVLNRRTREIFDFDTNAKVLFGEDQAGERNGPPPAGITPRARSGGSPIAAAAARSLMPSA